MTARDTAPWRALRDMEPALGSQRRVLAKIEDELDAAAVRRPAMGRAIAIVTAVAAGVAVLWLTVPAAQHDEHVRAGLAAGYGDTRNEGSASAVLRAAAVESASRIAAPSADAKDDEDGEERPGPELRLDRDDSMAVDLEDAAITVIGPAAVQVAGDTLLLHRGRVSIDGIAVVRGATCNARVSGSADVEATDSRLEVRVFAGSAEITEGTGCTVTTMNLDAPVPGPVPDVAPEPSPDVTANPQREIATPDSPPSTPDVPATDPPAEASSLRQQVEAFRGARALSGADALAAWRAIIDRWPDSPLREEADAAIIDALVALGRTSDAHAAAKRFVAGYPNSPRADVYRALVQEPR